jgi:hypothetical protein
MGCSLIKTVEDQVLCSEGVQKSKNNKKRIEITYSYEVWKPLEKGKVYVEEEGLQ